MMSSLGTDYPILVKTIRGQLGISQEALARQLGVSFATVNRWENGEFKPSRMARVGLDVFCRKMVREGKLRLPSGNA